MHVLWLIGFFALLSGTPSAFVADAQAVSASSNSPYANNIDGMRKLLEKMRTAAKDNNSDELSALLKATEVPNCEVWLHKMYASNKADSWMELCDAKSLGASEHELASSLRGIAKQDGTFVIRSVNRAPERGNSFESSWLQAIRQPLDIYWAGWTQPSSLNSFVGYFAFIDGEFRWQSTIHLIDRTKIPVPDNGSSPYQPAQSATKQSIHGTTYQNETANFTLTVPSDWYVDDSLAGQVQGFTGAILGPRPAPAMMVQRLYPPGVAAGVQILERNFEKGYKNYKKLEEGKRTIDGKECYYFVFSALVPLKSQPKEVPMVFYATLIPDGQSVLMILAQSLEDEFAKAKPMVESVVNSFKSSRP